MAAWLIAAIERLSPGVRRMVVAAATVLALAGAISSLILEANHGGGARPPAPIPPARSRPVRVRPSARRLSPPVSAADLRLAGGIARGFLLSYLPFAYGRASGTSLKAATPGLRSQLMRERAQVTPVERARHPRVVSLRVLGTSPGFVLATASIEDGGIAVYRLRFALREEAGRWSVSDVQEG